MKKYKNMITFCLLLFTTFVSAHTADFKVKAKGIQTFNFADKGGRNQMIFYSKMQLEDITGTASGITGSLAFDPSNVSKTVSGELMVDVKSMQTGIPKRDEHMQGEAWLNAAKYPTITFKLKELKNIKTVSATQLEGTAVGDFTLHGVTKNISTPVTLVYMEESDKTKMRAPGDLMQLRVKFPVKLSDYEIKGVMNLIGQKINDQIDIEMNIVGATGVK